MANLTFDIATSEPIILEKWQQMKDATGSLTDILVTRYICYANVDIKGGVRTFQNGELKMSQSYNVIVRKKALDGRTVDVLWKVVYRGQRYAVLNSQCINKKFSDFLLTIEVK